MQNLSTNKLLLGSGILSTTGNNLYINDFSVVTGWQSKSITIENPQPGDDIGLFYTQNSIQVQSVQSIVRGAGLGSGQFSIRSDPARDAAGTQLLENDFVVTGRGTGTNFISFTNPSISGNNWTWIKITATGQTLSGLSTTIFYTNNY